MDHRNASIQFLRTSGLIPVKVPAGQKNPFPDWDPRTVERLDHELTIQQIAADRKLNLGALFSGKFVDIDVDTNELSVFIALEHFLPKTQYVWGRKSKPNSHRVYNLHEDFERGTYASILRFMKALQIDEGSFKRSFSVEIRGGKPENGLFTVLPGSYREDVNEQVEWSNEIDPTISGTYIPAHSLVKAVRLALASAVLSTYYGPGVRNDMSMAISGLLWRVRSSSMVLLGIDDDAEAPIDGSFFLRRDDANSIFECITAIADDNTDDLRARQLNFKNTWDKLERDPNAPVTGGKVLADLIGAGGEQVVMAIYRLLSDNDGIEQLEKLAEQFVIWYGQGVLIDTELVEKGHGKPWMSKEQSTNSLGGRRIKMGNKKIPLVNILFGSTIIQRVYGLTFDPGQPGRFAQTPQGLMVNQWRGFGMEPHHLPVGDAEIMPFLDYVKNVVAAGNEGAYKWVLGWCADLLQQPGDKPGTALVLVGPQGAGKTFLGEHILCKIIGAHSVQINKIESLTDKFNSITANKVFVQCDEAIHSFQRNIAAQLKSLITDETMTMEPKGIDSYKIPNHMHMLFTSNEENTAIFIDPSPFERRFTVLKVSADKAADVKYWTEMHEWVPANLPKIMRWLLDHNYNRQAILRPFDTSAKRDIQKVGVEPEVAWIVSRIVQGFPISEAAHQHWWQAFHEQSMNETYKRRNTLVRDVWPDYVSLSALEQDFKIFVRGLGKSVYSGSVVTTIKKAFPPDSVEMAKQISVEYNDPRHGQLTKSRARLYTFPHFTVISKYLRERYGAVMDQAFEASSFGDNIPDTVTEANEEESEF